MSKTRREILNYVKFYKGHFNVGVAFIVAGLVAQLDDLEQFHYWKSGDEN